MCGIAASAGDRRSIQEDVARNLAGSHWTGCYYIIEFVEARQNLTGEQRIDFNNQRFLSRDKICQGDRTSLLDHSVSAFGTSTVVRSSEDSNSQCPCAGRGEGRVNGKHRYRAVHARASSDVKTRGLMNAEC